MGTLENRAHCCDCEQRKLRSLNAYRQNMMVLFYTPLALAALGMVGLFIGILSKTGRI